MAHRRGGPKISTPELAARKSKHARKRIAEPRYPAGDPAMPPRVKADDKARGYWDEYVPVLRAARTIDQSTGALLATLCCTLAAADRIAEDLRAMNYAALVTDEAVARDGRVTRTTKSNPLHRMAFMNATQIRHLCAELGLSPTSAKHAKAAPPAPEDADPFEKFLSQPPPS
jgi:P27 family predicted phage terminase small subunit